MRSETREDTFAKYPFYLILWLVASGLQLLDILSFWFWQKMKVINFFKFLRTHFEHKINHLCFFQSQTSSIHAMIKLVNTKGFQMKFYHIISFYLSAKGPPLFKRACTQLEAIAKTCSLLEAAVIPVTTYSHDDPTQQTNTRFTLYNQSTIQYTIYNVLPRSHTQQQPDVIH